jgi:cyclopropane fatty-acyl-phospholipid synthase-like methyltransferase
MARIFWILIVVALFLDVRTRISYGQESATQASAPDAEASSSDSEAAATESADRQYEPGRVYLGRQIAPPMHYSGAGWLTRASRVREENPAKLLKSLKLKPGQVVCDFGCGNGYHTLQLAKRVGPQGQVYAIDIQQEMLDLLDERASPRGLENIKPVLATAEDPGMPPATFDLVLMVDVYHELSHPPEVLATVRASLKPEGRLVLVEFREEDPDVPILPLHKMSQAQVLKELPPNGFKLVGQYDLLPWQHVLEFARDDSPLRSIDLRAWSADPGKAPREKGE